MKPEWRVPHPETLQLPVDSCIIVGIGTGWWDIVVMRTMKLMMTMLANDDNDDETLMLAFASAGGTLQ